MKTTLITGGNSGIGAAIAEMLLAQGEAVVSLGLEMPETRHDSLKGYTADLTDPADTADVAARIATEHEITALVHNAGIILPNLLPDADPQDVLTLAQLHLAAPVALTQALLPGMEARGSGRILFISSRASMGMPSRSAYSATKAGVHGLARTWALELADKGITVNVIAPGPVLTDNFWDLVPKDGELQDKIAGGIPVKRIGTVDDIANAAGFFLDDKASFVTGQVLFVCGGASLGGLSI
ncbi:MAG: SDR family NAD(P)-dependent oxidoreductase [Paracoccaceae bacterium]